MMNRYPTFAFTVTALLTSFSTYAEDAPRQADFLASLSYQVEGQAEQSELRYWAYMPATDKKQVPLLLFLHGSGERGADLALVKKHGPPKLIDAQQEFPFLVVSPQCPSGRRWIAAELVALIDHVEEKYSIDKNRVYVTGLSMGGYGTWDLLATIPKRITAAIPICGRGDVEAAKKMVGVPIWVFHGDADKAVPLKRSQEMVDAIKQAGGSNVKLTVYPGVGHDSWTQTYANQEVYKWLLSHKLPRKD